MESLSKKRIAILATDGFEESEFTSPKEALENAGAKVDVISDKSGKIKSWKDGNWGSEFSVTKTINEANEKDYDGLMLPGGVINPDKLRRNDDAINFVKSFFKSHKPVGAICHAPWLLAEAGVLEGREITSFNSIKTDMINAGAKWRDSEVVTDHGLVTSRNPDDLPAFNKKLVEEIKEGKHQLQTA
ncbi:type 1 glutamine amidotransferase domain-containing protein [Portibacter lacus]|uniref:Protease n=1 Tax=Portibacter lacus TaxID=1099794 RepID=A0AA37SLZ8_9BACT|nr:type 1 glutamine amidotransferase domain-containing protein [Portibacter lacus]GLR16195.1 protease [Portibacter lacus]